MASSVFTERLESNDFNQLTQASVFGREGQGGLYPCRAIHRRANLRTAREYKRHYRRERRDRGEIKNEWDSSLRVALPTHPVCRRILVPSLPVRSDWCLEDETL